MGYDLHITRAHHWNENEGRQIEAQEWLNARGKDPDLVADPENGPYAAKWGAAASEGWLDWLDGNVYSTDPDQPTVTKMLEMAKELDGKVQGDDGEYYDSLEQWQEKAHT
jgi:hypothetical protein